MYLIVFVALAQVRRIASEAIYLRQNLLRQGTRLRYASRLMRLTYALQLRAEVTPEK